MYEWIRTPAGKHIEVQSASGGTGVATALVGGAPILPVRPGELSGPSLGATLDAWGSAGGPVRGQTAELEITRPMPSMPLHFWNDAGGSRHQKAGTHGSPANPPLRSWRGSPAGRGGFGTGPDQAPVSWPAGLDGAVGHRPDAGHLLVGAGRRAARVAAFVAEEPETGARREGLSRVTASAPVPPSHGNCAVQADKVFRVWLHAGPEAFPDHGEPEVAPLR